MEDDVKPAVVSQAGGNRLHQAWQTYKEFEAFRLEEM